MTNSLLAFLLVISLLPGTSHAQKVLRYSDHEPLGNMRTRFFKDVLFAAIEKESKGRLKIEDHWNATVATGYDALRLTGEGKAMDMAVVVPEYTAKQLPLNQLFKSFPVGPSGEKQVAFFRRAYATIPDLSAELEKNNVNQIFLGTGYPVAFLSTHPLASLADVQGHTWRTASFWHEAYLQHAQATTVSIPWGDAIFKAMQAGTLDGLMVNVDSAYDLKIQQVAPNVLLSRNLWLGHLYVLAINRDTWNGLAPEDKAAIRRAAQTAYARLGPVMDQSFDRMVGDLRQDHAKLRLLSASELQAWEATTHYQDVQTAWVKDRQAEGIDNVAGVLKKLIAILDAASSRDRP